MPHGLSMGIHLMHWWAWSEDGVRIVDHALLEEIALTASLIETAGRSSCRLSDAHLDAALGVHGHVLHGHL